MTTAVSPPANRFPGRPIPDGKLKEGYACDDNAALVFVNSVMKKSISLDKKNSNYFIFAANGKINEEMLPAEIIQ